MQTQVLSTDIYIYIQELAKNDDRIVIINQKRNIKKTLNEYGYPFKSKEFSLRVDQFNKGSNANFIKKYLDPKTMFKFKCPEILRYIFEVRGKYNISSQCCYKLKKALLHDWQKQNHKSIVITGMRNEEGGNRERLSCVTDNGRKIHPLVVVDEKWEDEFVKHFNIKLCKLYYPPFNFKRTGCKGCPYNKYIQEDLDVMYKLLPSEYKQALYLWKPIYDEYIRIGYRLTHYPHLEGVQLNLDDLE